MRKLSIKTVLIASLLLILFFSGQAMAAGKVVVVSGVSEEAAIGIKTYPLVYEGIKQALGEKGIVPEFQYANMTTALDDAARAELGKQAAAAVKAANPDVIMAIGDDAVKFIATQIDEVPVVFCYIFGDPKTLGMPKDNVTGVTRRSFAPDIWGLAKQLFGTKTVALLSKQSPSMEGVRKILAASATGLEKLCGVKYLEMYNVDTFDEWKERVNNFPADLMYLADTTRVVKNGEMMPAEDVVEWTVANAKVPVVAAVERDVKPDKGALYAILLSEEEIGLQAGKIVLSILDGKKPSEIPMQPTSKGALVINAKTAQRYKVDIPYEILSAAKKIYE